MSRLRKEVFRYHSVCVGRFAFQACSFNHSDILRFRINDLQTLSVDASPIVIHPPICRDHLRVSSMAGGDRRRTYVRKRRSGCRRRVPASATTPSATVRSNRLLDGRGSLTSVDHDARSASPTQALGRRRPTMPLERCSGPTPDLGFSRSRCSWRAQKIRRPRAWQSADGESSDQPTAQLRSEGTTRPEEEDRAIV